MDRSPRIDDRTMQDLVDEAKRLIPQLCPEWTNHGPSDPGIALVEVFAWMTDQVLQKLNAVPAQVYDTLLRLIGLDTFPAQAARADVVFYAVSDVVESMVIPAGTVVGTPTTADATGIDFQIERAAHYQPAEFVAVLSGTPDEVFTDHTDVARIAVGDGFSVFEPVEAGSVMLLGFRQSCGNHVLRVDVDSHVEGIGVDPNEPPIRWETWSGESWEAANVLTDSTGGLNRTGEVAIVVSDDHEPATLGGLRAYWLRARLLASQAGQGAYRTSPRLRSITVTTVGGVASATHSSPMTMEYLGTADGSPGLSFRTSRSPVLPRAEDEILIVRSEVWDEPWEEVHDFSYSGPHDRHYTFSSDTGTVRFGPRVQHPDGRSVQHGMVPPDGSEVVISGYRVGGGAIGNVGADTITVLRSEIPGVARVGNFSAAVGGADAETIDNARLRAPLWLQTSDRAVTAADFERIALWAHPDVARAQCREQDERRVRLAIVPQPPPDAPGVVLDDLTVSQETLDAVRQQVDERRILGTSVEIGTPFYQGVSVVARVRARPGRSPEAIQMRCLDALSRRLDPIVGGSNGTGWPFDQDIDVTALGALLSVIEGVDDVMDVLLFEADLLSGARLGSAMTRIALDRQSLPLLHEPQVVVE